MESTLGKWKNKKETKKIYLLVLDSNSQYPFLVKKKNLMKAQN